MPSFISPARWFRLDYPDDWVVEIDDDCTSFFREVDGVGALQVSAYETELNESAFENLTEYLGEKGIDSVVKCIRHTDAIQCAYSTFFDDASFYKIWMFASNKRFAFVTYVRDVKDAKNPETAEVEEIVRSFRILQPSA